MSTLSPANSPRSPRTDVLITRLTMVGAGLAIAASMPPWGWWPLAFVGVALLDRLIVDQPARARFTRGFGVGFWWMFPATLWVWDLTPPGYIIIGLIFSAFYGLGALAVPPGRRGRLALPAALVVVAMVRWSFPFGGVPLATLAMSQSDAPLGQTARVFGSLLIVALVGVAGVGLAALSRRQWTPALLAAAVLVAGLIVAAIAPDGRAVDSIDIAIVQGGGPQNTRATNTSARAVTERHLEATLDVETPVDLILWPENVVHTTGEFEGSPVHAEIAALAAQLDAPIIPGIIESYKDDGYFNNASVIVMPDGEIVSRYDKVQRVPFGEYVPLRSIIEPLAPDFLPATDARSGTGPAVLDSEFGRLGISISWEVFFDRRARDAMNNGGRILLNPTNGSSYWLTIVQTQQIASSKLRAIETGRYVLQAAPTGLSAIVEPDGTVIDRSAVSERKVIHGTVELREGLTLAVRWGPWPMLVLAVAALAVAWWRSDLDHEGGGPVVDELDRHVRSEATGGDLDAQSL